MKSKFGTRTSRYNITLLAVLSLATSVGCDRNESSQATREPTLVVDRAPAGIKKREVEFGGGKVRLLGYTRQSTPMRAGKRATVTLYWQAKEKIEPGYRLSTQLLDDAGERILDLDNAGPLREHKDGKPVLSPDTWEPGKVYVDQLTFTVPASVKTWRVQIAAGLKKGDAAMPTSDPEATDGMVLVATSSTGVRRARKAAPPRQLRIDRLDAKQKIKIDGKLDDEAWKEAPVATLGDVNTGRPKARASLKSNVRVLYDNTGFYVGFEVKDTDIVGGFDPHVANKDSVALMIDPEGDGDNLDYYEIHVSPQNVIFDTHFDTYDKPSGGPKGPFGHEEWSAKLKSATTIQGTVDKSDDKDEGYVVEAFLPWKSFDKVKQLPPAVGDTWRVNFFALEPKEMVTWTPINGKAHRTSSYGRLLWAEKGFQPKDGAASEAAAPKASAAALTNQPASAAKPAPAKEAASLAVKNPEAPAVKPPSAPVKAPPSVPAAPATPPPAPATPGK